MSSTEKINLLSSDVFNSEPTTNVSWRNLTIEKRVEIIKKYFDLEFNHEKTSKTIDKNTMYILTELVLKGKLKLKKEITFDNVNQRIIRINVLVQEKNTDNYIYKPDVLIKKEQSKKIAKSMLFRNRNK